MTSARLPRWFEPRTIPGLIAQRAAESPQALALIVASPSGSVTKTFLQLFEEAQNVARGLKRWGVVPGDRVVWILDNSSAIEALTLYHGVMIAGAVNVPVNTRLVAREVDHIFERTAPALVVYRGDKSVIPSSAEAIQTGGDDWIDLINANDVSAIEVTVRPDDQASILFTSGTTGSPRGVVHTQSSSLAAGIGWADAFRLGPRDVLQSPFPVFTGAGLHFIGLSALWAGASNVIDGTDIDASLGHIAEYGTTVFVAVPSIYQYWLESPALSSADLRSIRILDYGGAAMPPEAIRRLRQVMPDVGLMQTYGLTEAGPGGLYLHEDYAMQKLGSIGNRGAGQFTQFRVVDDVGNDVGPDEVGELVLRGPSIMTGYLDDPEGTAAAFTSDGWLRSGDDVRLDSAGFVYFVDRRKDIIVRGGFNVASAEVEAALLEHPSVLEVAVVGRPHVHLGEDVHAVVVLKLGFSVEPEELVRHAEGLLAAFKVPRTIELRKEALPRNASGKVQKTVLRGELWP